MDDELALSAEPGADPVAELAAAQRRQRRRALLVTGAIAAALVTGLAFLAWWTTRPGPAVPPITRPWLWQVRAPDGARPSYLFGTIHIGYGVGDLPAAVRAAQDGARVTILESDLLDPGAPRTAAAPLPRHRGRDRLGDAQWRRLAELVDLDEASLVEWDSSQLLGAALASQAPRIEPMDVGLQRRAVAAGQPLVFLETRQLEQVMDEAAILDGLEQVIAHPGLLRGELRRIIARYAAGADGGCRDRSGPVGELTSGLDHDWVTAIAAEVERGGAFVAIGCGHLDGPDSVVEQLRARGFQVERSR